MSLPLHPLVIHATIALLPALSLMAPAFTAVGKWRWLLRWPTAIVAVLATISLFVARSTGDALAQTMDSARHHPLISRHEELANLLTIACVPLMIAVLLAAWTLPSTSPLVSGAGAREAPWGAVGTIMKFLVPVLAVAVLVLTIMTGHAGATAVWTH